MVQLPSKEVWFKVVLIVSLLEDWVFANFFFFFFFREKSTGDDLIGRNNVYFHLHFFSSERD